MAGFLGKPAGSAFKAVISGFTSIVFDNIMLHRLSGLAPGFATCGAFLCALLALIGYSILGFLYLARHYAPASHHYVRPLHFDYTGPVAVAWTPLSPNLQEQAALNNQHAFPGAAASALLPKSRFLHSGSQVAVHVALTIPADHTDLFQLTGELLSNSTHVAARSTRTYINTPQPYVYRMAKQLLFMPFHILGFGHGDWAYVDLPLFEEYEERQDTPVTVFRARLASRNASRGALPPPPVRRAELHVRLRLGLLRSVLFWLRPGLAISMMLLLVGLTASMCGTTGAVALLFLAFFLRRWIAKTVAADKSKARRVLLPAPPRPWHKVPPYGSFDDALSYSLAHAEFYRDERSGTEDEDAGVDFPRPAHSGVSRRGSTFSEAAKMYEDDTVSRGPTDTGGKNAAYEPVDQEESAAWSGSSGESLGAGGLTGDTMTATSKPVGSAAAEGRPRSGRPTPSPSPQRPAGEAVAEEQQQAENGPNAASADGDFTEEEGGEEEGHAAQDDAAGEWRRDASAPGNKIYEDDDFEGDAQKRAEMTEAGKEDVHEEGEEQGGVAGGKDAREDAQEGQSSDLAPQADNEVAGAALRRRPVFAWKP